ncbi:type I polyketide synthase [Sinorhizobium chiapasense]
MAVEIIGRACLAPGAESPSALFKLLRQGKCTVTSIPSDRWDVARFWHPVMGTQGKTYSFAAGVLDQLYDFDPAVFGMSQREAMYMDPQQRVLLQLAWRALEDANISATSLQGENVGVYIGASSLDHANLTVEDPAAAGPYFMTGNTLSIVSNRISHIFGLSGPSMTVDTACSSSLVALDQAMRALTAGEIDTAIVGGVNILAHPLPFVGFAQARMLSPEGLCRAYDNDGAGYVRAEGGVVFILRRSDRARREKDRSYARIVATGVNSAGRTNGISLPSREAQANLLRAIYEGNGIDANQVAFVEGHGTGTKVGDPAEVWSIGTVIGAKRRAPVPIGSIKSNIGHTEPASGLFGMLKAVMALENNYLPASLHFDTPNEHIDFDGLNVRVTANPIELLRGKRARLAGINSFGFGGANAHVVISDPEPAADERTSTPSSSGHVFLASAHTASSLEALLSDYKAAFAHASKGEARAMIAASGANRTHMRHRFAARSDQPEDIVRAIASHLEKPGSGIGEVGEAVVRDAKVAFVFSGNGSQWAGMGVEAFRENLHFRQCFTSVSALFKFHSDIALTDLLTDPDLDKKLADTKIAQPLLFAVQAALSDSLVAMGIKPVAVFGHSVGEIAAAYAAGALSLVDAVSIVAKRSLHQDLLAGSGTMAAVMLGEEAARAFAEARGLDDLCVAAVNAHNSVTISGPADQISTFRDAARKAKIPVQILDINYPFHHPIIDRAKDAFLSDIPDIAPRRTELAYLSTVTGAALEGTQLDPDYWWKNVREPVRFQAAAEAAIEMGCRLFIEISPRPILSSYVKETIKQAAAPGMVVPTLLRDVGETGQDPISAAMARAVAHGAVVDTTRVFGKRNASIALPSLPFEPVELRPAATTDATDLFGRTARPYRLTGWRSDPNSGSWKNHVDAHLFPDLAEHVVDGKAILPGSGFIEIAVAAAQQFYGSDEVEITNLEIVRPLELSETKIMELSTVLSPETGDIEIRSRERLSEDDWAVHAVARCRKPLPAEERSYPSLAGLAKTATVAPARAYETAKQFGLDYGPRFQLLAKAVAYGDRLVDVELKTPDAAGHPLVAYALNPISVDATFHGLVALFDRFTGDKSGAPYIPVRFGSVRVVNGSQPIARAMIEIERVSANSIKAKFHFFDKSGAPIAHFEDCRFRRTYLRKHKTLDALSFHYEAVQSEAALPGLQTKSPAPIKIAMPAAREAGVDNTTLLFNAAIYRACQEIALKLGKGRSTIQGNSLPGDFAFQCFLTSCLYVLEDAGLCEHKDGVWTVAQDFNLPGVPEILRELYGERSDRAVEAVLINNAYAEALARLDALQAGDEAALGANFISDATLDHQAVHSEASRERMAFVLEALEKALTAQPAGARLRIVELGSVSSAFTRRLATLAEKHGASLTVFEARDNAQRGLELAFENDAHVRILKKGELATLTSFDLVVSASEGLYSLIEDDVAVRTALRSALRDTGGLIAAVSAPSLFNDFALGLSEGWFARSQTAEFPIGNLAAVPHWQKCLGDLDLRDVNIADRECASGNVILLEAHGAAATSVTAEAPVTGPYLLLQIAGDKGNAPSAPAVPVDLSGDIAADKAALLSGFEALGEQPLRAIFLASPAAQSRADDSASLQTQILALGAFAEALRQHLGGAEPAGDSRPRLVLVAPGGAPIASRATGATVASDGVNAGLWAFARVLQNEYEFLDVHALDIDGSPTTIEQIAAASPLLGSASANREWLIEGEDAALSEIRAVPGPVDNAHAAIDSFKAATIRQRVSSQVGSIVWEESDIPAAGPGEVVVAVAATGLNFRDVMWAMGLLPEEALEDGFAGATIGMELSGHVVAVGAGVDDLAVGDAVMAIASSAFSTHAVVSRAGVARLPQSVSPVAAATVPVAFLTAYYAMVELGRIQPDETILIHGAAGGVGLAALQVAKLKGAKVIATAGTREKRRFLSMLGADHVFDSRSLGFVNDVRAVTNGEGVDLVLNSLFAEAMEQSLALVKPFGRFLELGKRDYYADSKIGLRPFRRNVSYFGIDADQLLVNQPKLTKRIFTEIGALFEEGKLTPLPYRAFDFDEIGNAFRLMQNAGHIGKIVVLPPVVGKHRVAKRPHGGMKVDPNGMHLVIGGIGGFGLAAANWLVEKGATKIALCSRRGQADAETTAMIEVWAKAGVSATVHACDVTDPAATERLLKQLRAIAPLRSIVHAAMVLDDALISNLNRERNRPVIDTKAKGAAVLDRLTNDDRLDNFILFSSATTLVGNPGQANYVAANGYLEGLARARRARGLAGLAVGFGAIADKGYLVQNTDVNDLLAKRIGKTALKAQTALDMVESHLAFDPGTVDAAVVMISEIDWSAARNLPVARNALFEVILRSADQHATGGEGAQMDLVAMIEGKSPQEAEDILFDLVAGEIAGILRVSKDTVTRAKVLKEIGLDSLMAVELGMSFQQNTGFDMPLSGVADNTTVGDVARKLYEKVSKRDQSDDAEPADDKIVSELAQRHVGTAKEKAQSQ